MLLDGDKFGFEGSNGIALGSKVPVNEQSRRDEVRFETALAPLEIVRFGPHELLLFVLHLEDLARLRARLPAFGGDEVAIVLHGLGPVVHQVLIEIVGIEKRRSPVRGEQMLGDGFDELFGMAAVSESLEPRGISLLLIGEERCRGILKGREFTVAEDRVLHFRHR